MKQISLLFSILFISSHVSALELNCSNFRFDDSELVITSERGHFWAIPGRSSQQRLPCLDDSGSRYDLSFEGFSAGLIYVPLSGFKVKCSGNNPVGNYASVKLSGACSYGGSAMAGVSASSKGIKGCVAYGVSYLGVGVDLSLGKMSICDPNAENQGDVLIEPAE